ncbi:Tc toxin subunit A [Pseudomonas sp. RT6P73]
MTIIASEIVSPVENAAWRWERLFEQLSLPKDVCENIQVKLNDAHLTSVFMIAQFEEDRFVRIYTAALGGWARDIYRAARLLVTQHQHQHLLETIHDRNDSPADTLTRSVTGGAPFALTFQTLFNESWPSLCIPGQIEAWDSPAAYLLSLYRNVAKCETIEPTQDPVVFDALSLAHRRRDLNAIILSAEQLKTSTQALTLVNPLLEQAILNKTSHTDVATLYKGLATTYYPMPLPFHLPYTQVKQALQEKNIHLGDVVSLMTPLSGWGADDEMSMVGYLEWSPPEHAVWMVEENNNDYIDPLLRPTDQGVALITFCRVTGLARRDVEELLCLQEFALSDQEGASSLEGRYYITGTRGKPVTLITTADGQAFLQCTDQQVLRMLQMIRLHQLLDAPYGQLDALLSVCFKNYIMSRKRFEVLHVLGLFRYLSRKCALTLELFIVLLGGSLSVATPQGLPSFFDRIFNTKGQFEQRLSHTSLPANAEQLKICPANIISQLCAGIGVNAVTLTELALHLDKGSTTSSPSGLAYCSRLYAFSKLSALFGLKPQELLIVCGWRNCNLLAHSLQPEEAVDILLRLDTVVSWLRQQQWTVAELQSILSADMAKLDSDRPVILFLEKLATLAPQLSDDAAWDKAIIQAVAHLVSVSPDRVPLLLKAMGQTTEAFRALATSAIDPDKNVQQEAIASGVAFTCKFMRYAAAISLCGMSAAGVEAWVNHPDWFVCWDSQLSFDAMYSMRAFVLLLNAINTSEAQVLSYLSNANSESANDLKAASTLLPLDLSSEPRTSRELLMLSRAHTLAEKTGLSEAALNQLKGLLTELADVEKTYEAWQSIANQLIASVSHRPD